LREIDGIEVTAPTTGWLCGLTHDGARVETSGRVVAGDVREPLGNCECIGAQPLKVAGGAVGDLGREELLALWSIRLRLADLLILGKISGIDRCLYSFSEILTPNALRS
jgi:hypothetical protein